MVGPYGQHKPALHQVHYTLFVSQMPIRFIRQVILENYTKLLMEELPGQPSSQPFFQQICLIRFFLQVQIQVTSQAQTGVLLSSTKLLMEEQRGIVHLMYKVKIFYRRFNLYISSMLIMVMRLVGGWLIIILVKRLMPV